MGSGPRYRVPFRRRREGKTDYRKRLKLLLSGKPRVVVRKTLRHTIVQVIEFDVKGDRVLASAHSNELKKYGWKANTGNLPASYLTGLLCGKKALKKGIKEGVLDIGLHSPIKGARIFAALKGLVDAGMEIPHSEEVFPQEERIKGKHISDELPEHFEEVKSKIESSIESGA